MSDTYTPHPDDNTVIVHGGTRLALMQSTDGWWHGWSPRNQGFCAEGDWQDWVTLAEGILAHPRTVALHKVLSDEEPPTGCADHQPVQHRDGKPPWCRVCGLTESGQIPERRQPDRPDPRPVVFNREEVSGEPL